MPMAGNKLRRIALCAGQTGVRVLGRSLPLTQGIAMDFSCAGVEICLFCRGRIEAEFFSCGSSYFTLYFDGVRQPGRLLVPHGESCLVLALGMTEGEHTIRLEKQAHAALAQTTLVSIAFDGEVGETPLPRARFLEFIGDSITAGWGLIGGKEAERDQGGYLYMDGTQAYAALTAEALKADASMVAVSGAGVCCGCITLPEAYPLYSWARDRRKVYDFVRRPDAVIVNLGTNDYLAYRRGALSPDAFSVAAARFLADVRRQNADPPLIWCYGVMNDTFGQIITQTIADAGGAGAGLYALRLDRGKSGACGHPDLAEQRRAAEQLLCALRPLLSVSQMEYGGNET